MKSIIVGLALALAAGSSVAQESWRLEGDVATCEAKAASSSAWYALVPSSSFDRMSACFSIGASRPFLKDTRVRVAFVELGDLASVTVTGGGGKSSARGAFATIGKEHSLGQFIFGIDAGVMLYQSKIDVNAGTFSHSDSYTGATPVFGLFASHGPVRIFYRHIVDVKVPDGVTDGRVAMIGVGLMKKF